MTHGSSCYFNFSLLELEKIDKRKKVYEEASEKKMSFLCIFFSKISTKILNLPSEKKLLKKKVNHNPTRKRPLGLAR